MNLYSLLSDTLFSWSSPENPTVAVLQLWLFISTFGIFVKVVPETIGKCRIRLITRWIYGSLIASVIFFAPLTLLFPLIVVGLSSFAVFQHIQLMQLNNEMYITLLKKHVVMVDKDGELLDLKPRYTINLWTAFGTIPTFDKVPSFAHAAVFNPILDEIDQHSRICEQKVLFFVHGGLNSYRSALKRVLDRIQDMAEDEPNIYPVFILWRSGLMPCYLEHLYRLRQGRLSHNKITSVWMVFVTLVADIGRGLTRVLKTATYQARTDLKYFYPRLSDRREANSVIKSIRRLKHPYFIAPNIKMGGGKPHKTRMHEFFSYLNALNFSFSYAVWPLIDAMGKSSWDVMFRRTRTMFRSPFEFEPTSRFAMSRAASLKSSATGGLACFIRAFQIKFEQSPRNVILIGHSMGTIVLNNWLYHFPSFRCNRIVYMAAACSIKDCISEVVPYLIKNPKVKFFNLCLHMKAESGETHAADFSPRGSLLEWIDSYFTLPLTFDDRTLGKWENVILAAHLFPISVRRRVYIKCFEYGIPVRQGNLLTLPMKHGDFTSCAFWKDSFWW